MINSRDVINTKKKNSVGSNKWYIWRRKKFFFDDNKLVIEVDELGHKNRDIDCKTERQKAIEKDFGWKFIRINPAENDYIISYISKNQLKIINREDPKKTITIRI